MNNMQEKTLVNKQTPFFFRTPALLIYFLLTFCTMDNMFAGYCLADQKPFRVGFSTGLFSDINENDAKASIRAWAEQIARVNNIQMDPDVHMYKDIDAIVYALQAGNLDAISFLFQDFLEAGNKTGMEECFATESNSSLFEKYIVLTHVDSGIKRIEDLNGRSVIIRQGARMSLADDWLDRSISKKSSDNSAADFFGSITKTNKVSLSVLPVFFKKSDAAVVNLSGFNAICELNPKLKEKLEIIEESSPLIPALICFRKDFDSAEKKRIIEAFKNLHKTPAGRQILTVFKSEALILLTQGQLEESINNFQQE